MKSEQYAETEWLKDNNSVGLNAVASSLDLRELREEIWIEKKRILLGSTRKTIISHERNVLPFGAQKTPWIEICLSKITGSSRSLTSERRVARRDNKKAKTSRRTTERLSTELGVASNYNVSPKEWKAEEKQFHTFFEELILELKELTEKSLVGYVA